MKPQDIVFIIIALFLIIKPKPERLISAGLVCVLLSIPLFSFWVFFTAERLLYYAVFFFLVSILILLFKRK